MFGSEKDILLSKKDQHQVENAEIVLKAAEEH